MPSPRANLSSSAGQRGTVMMLLLLLVSVGALAVFVTGLNRATQQLERDRITNEALARAKEALIGWAATYRDSHANEVFGYLPCPDTDNDGVAEPSCDSKDVSVIGRLPWKTLSLPPLRDGAGECLWYAVSGHAKDNSKTDELNWDVVGQFEIKEAITNAILAGAGSHNTPWAVILAPRTTIGSQNRLPPLSGPATECGGNNVVAAYLDGADPIYAGTAPAANANTTLTLSTADSVRNGTNSDQGLWITAKEIFDHVKRRSDFKIDIDSLMGDLANCLNNLSPASLPAASLGSKGTDNVIATCPAAGAKKINVLNNWKDNILYAKPASASVVNGTSGCNAVLFFGGERTASQRRTTPAERLVIANYLEGANAALFSSSGAYTGATAFSSAAANADVVRCIKGLPAGATQKSFANNFGDFSATGTLVSDVNGIKTYSTGVATNATDKTLTVSGAPGTVGGCFWYPDTIPLAGKTLRAYYDYQFSNADIYALPPHTGSDRGNGFTFQMVRNDLNASPTPPAICGLEADMGALALGGPGDMWGSGSFIIETDIHKDAAKIDPVENHSAIMYGGNLNHSLTNGNPTSACNGTAAGCRHNPANKFEESPSPLPHNQRIEIHTGCDSSCSSCDPTNHVDPNTYAQISAWVDCTDCDDVAVDLLGAELIKVTENRDFSAPGNWVGTNWLVAAGELSHAVAGADAATLPNSALTSPPVAGSTYQVAVKVATTTPGKLVIAFGGKSAAAINLVAGIPLAYTVRLTATSAGPLTLTPNAAWVGTIDNVSVKRLPTIQRCIALDTSMNSVYFGFTGGFRSGVNTSQGVTLWNLYLRSE